MAGLTWSRCYTASGAAIDCLTRHDPHRDAKTSPSYYEQKCLKCHSQRGKSPEDANSPGAPDEPIRSLAPSVHFAIAWKCHMPVVEKIVPHTRFTDHYIRIHRN